MVLTPKRLHFLVLVLVWSASLPACADRDIVYAARYYTPPGSHQTSHFHLYRINPDGTGRTQLTYGESEDGGPLWSPDGRKIAFWIDAKHLVGFVVSRALSGPPVLRTVATNGRLSVALPLEYPETPGWTMDRSSGDEDLLPSPHAGSVVWALKGHTDTNVYQSAFFEVHLPDRAMRFLAQGQFLAWSPDGKRFCTAPGRIPDFLGAAAGPQDAPLEIGAAGGKLKTIMPEPVWVTGADWRKGTL